jgi:hypothetical protein
MPAPQVPDVEADSLVTALRQDHLGRIAANSTEVLIT